MRKKPGRRDRRAFFADCEVALSRASGGCYQRRPGENFRAQPSTQRSSVSQLWPALFRCAATHAVPARSLARETAVDGGADEARRFVGRGVRQVPHDLLFRVHPTGAPGRLSARSGERSDEGRGRWPMHSIRREIPEQAFPGIRILFRREPPGVLRQELRSGLTPGSCGNSLHDSGLLFFVP